MNEKRMRAALDTITRRDIPDDANLWPRIVSQLNKRNSNPIINIAKGNIYTELVLYSITFLSG